MRPFRLLALALTAAFLSLAGPSANAQQIQYVFHISIDGLRPDGVTNLLPLNQVPNFARLASEGAFTYNARNDYDYTITLPNHTTQLTSRGVTGTAGHGWTSNSDPAAGQTLASNKGSYVAGAFDVAHDNGLRTAVYAGKTKFSLFDTSWNATNGAVDSTGPDNGRDKLNRYVYNANTASLVNTMRSDANGTAYHYVFLHLTDLDNVGHSSGWNPAPGSAYSNAVRTVDGYLGQVFNLVTTNAQLIGRTAIVVTADHGGTGTDHSNATLKENYKIPFYVWGPGVTPGADLYELNEGNRQDPGDGRPTYADSVQPVRNGEAGNLCLQLLGLDAITGSTINDQQDLVVHSDQPAAQLGSLYIFCNATVWDGNNPAANASDDGAIRAGKSPLRPGQTASAACLTGFGKGINGLMVDIVDAINPGAIGSSDFVFRTSPTGLAGSWVAAPSAGVSVRLGAGLDGGDRVTVIWADNAIQDCWLRAEVLPTPRTGLAASEVFYWGNLRGDTTSDGKVNVFDLLNVQKNYLKAPGDPTLNPATDLNGDGIVGVMDLLLVRQRYLLTLPLMTVP